MVVKWRVASAFRIECLWATNLLGYDLEKIKEFQESLQRKEIGNNSIPQRIYRWLFRWSCELLEIFQWLTAEQSSELNDSDKEKVSEELADITYYLLRIADITGIDLEDAVWKKMKKNADKYPVEKAKGNAKKYTEL